MAGSQKIVSLTLIGIIIAEFIIFVAIYFKVLNAEDWVELIANHLILIAAILSNFHLATRARGYESNSPVKKYMMNLSLFFIPVAIFSIVYIVSIYFVVFVHQDFFTFINTYYKDIEFYFFGSSIQVRIPFNSMVLFLLVIAGLIFLIYPIEHYVKQLKLPWHTMTNTMILVLGILLWIPALVDNQTLVSITLCIVVIILFINVIFLFWTYFAVAVKAPPSPLKTGGYFIAFALFMFIFSWLSAVFIKDLIATLWLAETVTYIIASSPIILINIGFYILRPIQM